MTRDLVKFCILGENIEKGWPHFEKKVLKTSISNEYTQKVELNSIDFKNTCDTELNFTIYPTWPQPHLNTS